MERKQRLFTDLVRALSLALDFEDGERLHHAWRVAILAYHIGRLTEHGNPSLLYYAGLLHDIGGINLDHHVLHYMTAARPDPAVYSHGEDGAHILEPLGAFALLVPIIRHHHEHIDGSGFPLGLRAGEFPAESSIILAADLLDIHLRDRPDKAERARRIMEDYGGTVLPKEITGAVGRLLDELPDLLELIFDPDSIKRLLFAIQPTPPDLSDVTHLELLTQLLWVFARIIDSKHTYTMGHSIRTSWLACRIADALPEQALNKWDLIWAALLHDAGEIGIPSHIIDKPGMLTPFEWVVVKKHTQDTMQILGSIRDLEYLAYSASSNHESYDGTGYPYGTRGEEIPLIGRILALADAYDAMRSDRPHRRAMSHASALEELARMSGTRFDPSLVPIALTAFDEHGEASRNLEVTHGSFAHFFESSAPSLAPLLKQSTGEKYSTVMQGESGVVLFELEAWKRLELSDDLEILSEPTELADLCGPLGDQRLKSWLVDESREQLEQQLPKLGEGETLTRYLFARSGTPIETVFLRKRPGYTLLFRSAKNRIESFRGLTSFYRNFISSSEAVVFTDPKGIITDVNRKFLDLYEYRIRDVIGRPVGMVGSRETDPATYRDMWAAISDRNRGTWTGELVNLTASGRRLNVQLSINSIRDASGNHLGFIGHTLDITARKLAQEAVIQREAELREKNRELQKLNDLKSDMVSITSHDLKSPVNTILTITAFLRESLATMDHGQIDYFLSQIEEKGEQSIRFISDMLDLAKMESGNYEVKREVVHLSRLLRGVVGDHATQARSKEISLSLNPLAEYFTIAGDTAKLNQVFANLVGNAIKFSPEGGTITLGVGLNDANTVCVTVDDEGPGIPQPERASIFDKYYQINKDQQAARRGFGSGLGLYIVKNIVTSHGGTVTVEESPSGGTRMAVELPLFDGRGGVLLVDIPTEACGTVHAVLRKVGLCGVEVNSKHLISPRLENQNLRWVIMGTGPLSVTTCELLRRSEGKTSPRSLRLQKADGTTGQSACDRVLLSPPAEDVLEGLLKQEVQL